MAKSQSDELGHRVARSRENRCDASKPLEAPVARDFGDRHMPKNDQGEQTRAGGKEYDVAN